jgi:uncharacterized membrane protein
MASTGIKIIAASALLTYITLSTAVLEVQAQIRDPQPVESIVLDAIPPRVGDDGALTADPGDVLQSTIKVRNSSNQTITIKSSALDFIIDADGETPVPLEGATNQRWSLASWITLSPEYQELAPNELGQINVIITVPDDALPGGHYAMVTHQPASEQVNDAGEPVTAAESAAFINQRVGSLFYLVVSGPINEEAFIRDVTFPRFTEFGPVPFAFAVDNQSDIHIKPRISVEITNIFGKKVETIQLTEKNIFPLSSRNYEGIWDRMWGIGPYKASVVMSFGSTGQVVTAHQNFWLFPITLFWVFVIIVIVLAVIIIAVRRHIHHRNNGNNQRVQELEKKIAALEQQQNQRIDS